MGREKGLGDISHRQQGDTESGSEGGREGGSGGGGGGFIDKQRMNVGRWVDTTRYRGHRGDVDTRWPSEGLLGFSFPVYPFYPYNQQYHNGTWLLGAAVGVSVPTT